jgi:glutamyl-tRNA synthetase
MATLTLSSKQTPFPWAAVAIAAHTGKVDVVYDETVAAVALSLNGSTITEDDAIIQAIAKEGGLADDSAKVSLWIDFSCTTGEWVSRYQDSSPWQNR